MKIKNTFTNLTYLFHTYFQKHPHSRQHVKIFILMDERKKNSGKLHINFTHFLNYLIYLLPPSFKRKKVTRILVT